MLDAVVPDTDIGRVYGTLVRHPRCGQQEVVALTGLAPDSVTGALHRLAERGLVINLGTTDEGPWEARPLEAGFDALLRAEEQRLTALRDQQRQLADVYRHVRGSSDRYPGLELITGEMSVVSRSEQMQLAARSVVRRFECSPYIGDRDELINQAHLNLQRDRMAAGVRYQAVYHDGVYDSPVGSARMMTRIGFGEEARILGSLPTRLLIADDRRALLPLGPGDPLGCAILTVPPSGLLSALIKVFDALWKLAVPISATPGGDPLSQRTRQILTLMAAGATDDTIARRLGLSRRTVVRQTSLLLEQLGATTRFQAGVQAARRGWLGQAADGDPSGKVVNGAHRPLGPANAQAG